MESGEVGEQGVVERQPLVQSVNAVGHAPLGAGGVGSRDTERRRKDRPDRHLRGAQCAFVADY